jgi:N6-adenosine-specific RNA methylase IME4
MTRILGAPGAHANLFAPLPVIEGGAGCVHADPPWGFRSNSVARPGRNAMRHYQCLTPDEIAALPVRDVVARDAFLWLWVPGPFLVIGAHLPIVRAWGFEPTAIGFSWVKLRRSHEPNQLRLLPLGESDLHIGLGHTTRKNAEFCVLGRRGKPKRLSAAVREVIFAPVREPSRKPDEVYARIERFCAGPRLDLFGRCSRPNWTVWGDEATKFDPSPEAPAIPWLEAAE